MKFYVCTDVTHTHAPCLWQGGVRANEVKMRVKRNEDEMKDYLTGTRGGERKRRGREQTHTNTPGPERANPERGKRREKRRPTDTEQDQRRGGKTEAPEPT